MARSLLSMLTIAGSVAALASADAEPFVDFGLAVTKIEADIATLPDQLSDTHGGLHLGAGVRRELTMGSIGARLELDDVDGDLLLAVRAFDYRRYLSARLAVTAFVGAARLDLATPAYGYYLGAGLQVKEVMPRFDIGIDFRLGDKIARDNLLPSDPQGGRPDNFYDLSGVSLYLTRRF